jgi:hypothetical protein
MLPRSPVGSSRGTPSHDLAALPFSLIHFGSAANTKLVALPKKSCFLAAVVKNGGGAVGLQSDMPGRAARELGQK